MGFRARLAEVHARFSDRLEAIAHNRVELQKPNDNPGLLMFLLNTNRPDKYRPSATPVHETVKSVLATLQELGAQSLVPRDLQPVESPACPALPAEPTLGLGVQLQLRSRYGPVSLGPAPPALGGPRAVTVGVSCVVTAERLR